ncbi:uncharacterized protein LOC130810914 [Amaranthus tricolor]|uniref:uncharacterized protein LOC130810914 n=1 Tax=Amaranthus tricolor TaxID=29722 RepID=UPI00258873D0|nr:uncharacterized protein LOC130810914 [Amaranthus tricolor]
MSTEEMLNTLTKNMIQFQDETRSSIKNIERQMGQISEAVSKSEARDSEKLPSQTEPNPRMNASAMTLRSEIELQGNERTIARDKELQEETVVHQPSSSKDQAPLSQEEKNVTTAPLPQYEAVPPFPVALKERKKHEADKDIYEVFKKYVKFLKELCTAKRKQRLKGIQKVKMSEHISAIFQRKLPPKCGDLADRSNAYPKGIVEDVLVKVGDLIFPADFYVLDMEHDKHATPILLGRPFMKTAKTKIDVDTISLTMEFDGSKVEFDIYDSMKFPPEDHSCFAIDLVDKSS